MAEKRVQRRLAAVLAADVVGYSRLMEIDEEGTRNRFNDQLENVIKPALDEHHGRLVKTMGDGFLVEFGSVVNSVQCAVDIQNGVVLRQNSEPDDRKLLFRIGVHLGDVIIEDDDIHGDGVNIAARLEGLAEPSGICLSDTVHSSLRNKLAIEFRDLGEQSVKNIAEPVRVYSVALHAPKVSAEMSSASDALFRRPAVAVLPFENMSGDPDQEFFADGLAEDLITALSQWRSFPVIARNSTFAYKGQSPDIRKVGEELGARYVIEGSVRKSESRLRVTAQLINTDTGHHVWAERYDRNLEDLFDIQDEITQQISAVIAPELDRAEHLRSAEKRPEKLDAWECYQRGMSLFLVQKRVQMVEAKDLFEHVMASDPTFVRAYFGYVWSSYELARLGFAEIDRDKVMHVARRAFELDRDDALSHYALGLIYFLRRDLETAISYFERSILLNPSFAVAHAYVGNALMGSGQAEKAIPHIEQAIRLNPRDALMGPNYARLARAHLFLQMHEEAVKYSRQGIRHHGVSWPIFANLASALAHLDRLDEARGALNEMNEREPGITVAFVREHTPATNASYMDHFLDGLRKAGLHVY
jgi:adenylate cyclase